MGYSLRPQLNGKLAVKINATYIKQTDKAFYLDCEGDKHWFPKSQCKFDPHTETAVISEWMYNQKFPEG